MCAIALKVVPKSMPTALRWAPLRGGVSIYWNRKFDKATTMPRIQNLSGTGRKRYEKTFLPFFYHHFLRPHHAIFPEKAALERLRHVHVLLRLGGHFHGNRPLRHFIELSGADGQLLHLQPGEHFQDEVEIVLDVDFDALQPLEAGRAFRGRLVGDAEHAQGFLHLLVNLREIVVEGNEVPDHRPVERIEEKT